MSLPRDELTWGAAVGAASPQAVPAAPAAIAAAPAAVGRRWAQAAGVVARRTMQGLMVLPPEGAAVVFAAPAAALWDELARPAPLSQVEARLLASGAATDGDQVARTLAALAAGGAIREVR